MILLSIGGGTKSQVSFFIRELYLHCITSFHLGIWREPLTEVGSGKVLMAKKALGLKMPWFSWVSMWYVLEKVGGLWTMESLEGT